MSIAIIGAGIAGASAAYHLTKTTNTPVTVYDRGPLASETTAKSGALFGDYGTPTERHLKQYGRSVYNRFLANPTTDARFEQIGRLDITTTQAGTNDFQTTAQQNADGPAAFARYIPGDDIHDQVFVPNLDMTPVSGALYRPHVGYFTPRHLALEFINRAQDNGAQFNPNTPVDDIHIDNMTVTGLSVDGTTVEPDAVVCAAGPWNPHLLTHIWPDVPVYHTLAPILKLPHHAPYTMPNISLRETGAYLIGRSDNSVLLGHYPRDPETTTIHDPNTVPETVPPDRRTQLRDSLATIVPSLEDAAVHDEWVGIRSHTPDGNPILGWTGIERLSVIAFNSSGIQLAPAAGRLIADQLIHGDPTDAYEAVTITRFRGFEEQRTIVSSE